MAISLTLHYRDTLNNQVPNLVLVAIEQLMALQTPAFLIGHVLILLVNMEHGGVSNLMLLTQSHVLLLSTEEMLWVG